MNKHAKVAYTNSWSPLELSYKNLATTSDLKAHGSLTKDQHAVKNL
jgi:hypothetical protein